MEVLIATKNKGKIKKYSSILKDIGIDYCTLEDINLDLNVEENGTTIKENAIIKAMVYYNKTKMPVLADDSGLIIDGLPKEKQPGMFVRRHDGKVLSDEEIIQLYSKEIEQIGGVSSGTFIISIAIIDEKGKIHTKETKHQRLFVSKPDKNRIPGYPLSSLIYDKETNMYMTQKQLAGIKVYKQSSFADEYDFIKSVLGGKNEKEEFKK